MPSQRPTECNNSQPLPWSESIDHQTRLWILRLLVPIGGSSRFITECGYRSPKLARALGLNDFTQTDFDEPTALNELNRLYQQAEETRSDAKSPPVLTANLERLKTRLTLSPTDCRLLEFAIILQTNRWLKDASDLLVDFSSTRLFRVLAALLDLPLTEIQSFLSTTGQLARSGLLRNGEYMCYGMNLTEQLELLSKSFSAHMMSEQKNTLDIFKEIIIPSPLPELKFYDFRHIGNTLNILRSYLKHAVEAQLPGVNIFIHGRGGTGKTQLARLLAHDVKYKLFEISSQDNDGYMIRGEHRLRAHRTAQNLLALRPALLLLDESADIFNDRDKRYELQRSAEIRNSWINLALDNNPVPTLWLSHSASCLVPAFVRRFDMILELTSQPPQRRAAIHAQGCQPSLNMATLVPTNFDPSFVNVDCDFQAIAKDIKRSETTRICLYGPAGTGKRAFASWLADQLERPLHVPKIFSILSPYIGETERNLSQLFREAEAEGAILLLDEADGFLSDRRSARYSWEISEVNAILTEIAGFNGIVIAATDQIEGLDPALLRRFDLKLRFNYLTTDQAWQLFIRQCLAIGLAFPPLSMQEKLARVRRLTPDDFFAVARQHRFQPITSSQALIDALIAECTLKDDAQMPTTDFI